MRKNLYVYTKMKTLLYRKSKIKFVKQKQKYVGRVYKNISSGNEYIKDKILSGEAFSCIRPGFDEINTVCLWDEHEWLKTERYKKMNVAKWVDDDKILAKWVDAYKQAMSNADMIGVYLRQTMGEYLWRSYSAEQTVYYDMECVNGASIIGQKYPWTMALKGKKVLIVSMFVDTMQSQYKRIENIWKDKLIWPSMDVIWLKSIFYAPNTDNQGMGDVLGVLEKMKKQVAQTDFDVALLCCSFFGTLLAGEIKKMGKQAIQMGGDMQLLFGIKGRRWEGTKNVTDCYNEYWVRPSEKERPVNYQDIESGCYW